MTPAELSRDLALALGYFPESVRVRMGGCVVYRYMYNEARWREFDYRDPETCLPLIEWLLPQGVFFTRDPEFPTWVMVRGCPGETYQNYQTLPEAVARAVIAVKQQEQA